MIPPPGFAGYSDFSGHTDAHNSEPDSHGPDENRVGTVVPPGQGEEVRGRTEEGGP